MNQLRNRRHNSSRRRTLETLEKRYVLDSTVVFNELMYHPEDGVSESLEWVELYNQLAVDMDISEWTLSGGIEYEFPNQTIVPGRGYVVVAAAPPALEAASGFDDALGPFTGRMDNSGDSIKLYNRDGRLMNSVNYSDRKDWPVGPDGSGMTLAKYLQTTASEDAASWTTSFEQGGTPGAANFFEDGSTKLTKILDSGDAVRVHVPSDGSLGTRWTELGFNDSSWTSGTTGIGYERNSGYEPLFGLDLADPPNNQPAVPMYEVNQTAYARIPFEVTENLNGFDSILLRMKYDDGFVAYINGTEVARGNAPDTVSWNSGASGSRSDGLATTFADYDITSANLVAGENILAIQGLNQSLTSSDFLILPEIVGTTEIGGRGPSGSNLPLAINEIEAADAENFWIELTNDGDEPIDLNGITVVATGEQGGSYIFGEQTLAAGEHRLLSEQQLGFHPWNGERLFLYAPDKTYLIDAQQVTNRLRGRAPDRDQAWLYPTSATPGSDNAFILNDDVVINEIMYHAQPTLATPGTPASYETTTLLPIDATWRYNASGDDLGSNWYRTTHEVDNSDWFEGRGLFGYEPSALPEPIRTPLPDPRTKRETTYYFQTEFNFGGQLDANEVILRHVVDDGAIIYLNGEEVTRFNMPAGNVTAATFANGTVGEASYSGNISIPENLLRIGNNVISAELHQTNSNSSDYIFGAELVIRGELTPATPGTPFAKSDEEWIEIYNRGDQTVDLSGWEFSEGVRFEFDNGTTIGPGEYWVVARNAEQFLEEFPEVNLAGEYSGSLSNSGESLMLVDANRNPADWLHYQERGEWPSYADGGGSSLELTDPFADNSKGGVWRASDESTKSSWQTYEVSRVTGNDLVGALYNEFIFGLLDSGEFLIDDISVVESGSELMQNGSFEGDRLGQSPDDWRLIGNHSGKVIVDPDDASNKVLHVVAKGAQQHVHDHVETTFVNNTRIRTGATYNISFRAKWLAGNRQINNRLYFTRIGNTIPIESPQDNGTPGAVNSKQRTNAGPTFANLQHAPVSPSSGQPVNITVFAEDPNGVTEVNLWWSVNGGTWRSDTMSDLGNGKFRGTIPGQSSGRIVQFYVAAEDGLDTNAVYPAAGRESRALYQVNSPSLSTRPIDTLQIVLLPGDESQLFSSVNRMSNNYRGGTLVHNGTDVYYDVQIRQVGSRFIRPNSGYKVKLNPEKKFYGVHESIRFDINGLKEIVYKQMINRAAGSDVSLYDDIAHLVSPNSSHTGSMLLNLARFEDVFLNEQFENGGDGTKWELDDVTYPTDPSPSPEGLKSGTGVSSPDIEDRGTDQEAYRGHLLIKNNRSKDDYRRLVEMAQAIHKSGNELFEATNAVMDVDLWMRHYATQSFLGNWDTYGFRRPKNLRVYERPSDRRIIPLAWDFDLANVREPLIYNGGATRLDEIRDLPVNLRLFWGHMNDLVNQGFNGSYISRWASHYGQLMGSNLSGETNLITTRANEARSQARRAIPVVDFQIQTNGGRDLSVNDATVTLRGTGWIDVREVYWKETGTQLDVTWTSSDDWRLEIPLQQGTNAVTLEAFDFQGKLTGSDTINVTSTVANDMASSVRITEINFNPYDPTTAELGSDDSLGNDDFEFIELRNIGQGTVNLLQARMTDGVDFTFPAYELAAGEFGLIVRDAEAFAIRYGDDLPVIGEYEGRLSNGGESIILIDGKGNVVLDFEYDDSQQWPQSADGIGASLVLNAPLATPTELFAKPDQWRGSTELGGSPGTDSSPRVGVVVNEILANTDPPNTASDSIELHNVTAESISVGGWYISDSGNNLFKYQIPDGTTIPAGGYLVLDEANFNPNPLNPGPLNFALSGARGDDVWVTTSADGQTVSTFVDDVHFGATPNGESMGRWPNGQSNLAPMLQPTFGQTNDRPRIGPLVISEIQYAPSEPLLQAVIAYPELTTQDLEFIEIHNPTLTPVDFTNWRVRGGIDLNFEAGTELAAGETMVIVPFNPMSPENQDRTTAFRLHYGLAPSVLLSGGFGGQLADQGERIELQRPDAPPLDEPNFIPHLWEDQVIYDNVAPWPLVATGESLQRLALNGFGNSPGQWQAAVPTPGIVNGDQPIADFNEDGQVDVQDVDLICIGIRGDDLKYDLTNDGQLNFSDVQQLVESILGTSAGDSNVDGRFNSTDLVQVFISGEYEDALADNSRWSTGDWNCDGDFTSFDIVSAFLAGKYDSEAAVGTSMGESNIAAAMADLMVNPGTTKRRVHQQTAEPDESERRRAIDLLLAEPGVEDRGWNDRQLRRSPDEQPWLDEDDDLFDPFSL
ncbi:MAG: hypothetical protein CMJ77_02335 [Planctomycetaceae bacterium]|nr:hypothetical protein [Planctomycetaceae bacterium]